MRRRRAFLFDEPAPTRGAHGVSGALTPSVLPRTISLMPTPQSPFRSGFVAVVGRPSTGKSSLINTALGQPVAPVSPRAHTTRRRQPGIFTLPHAQVIFVA